MPFLYRLASLLIALLVLPVQAAEMRVALLRTSGVETLDALTVDGGSWVRRVPLSHTAVLIEHHAATLLFDTGLGRDIDAQFRADMPWWAAPLFAYQKVAPARDQLDAAGIRVDRILLSHAHWDHASGLVDFPEVPVWAPYEEITFSRIATPPAAFPSQFRHGVRWRPYSFDPQPFMGFDESLDLFGDGRLVLVPLPGHTARSVCSSPSTAGAGCSSAATPVGDSKASKAHGRSSSPAAPWSIAIPRAPSRNWRRSACSSAATRA